MRYEIKRFLQSVITVLVVITITFVLIRLLPGDPKDILLQQVLSGQTSRSPEQMRELVEVYLNIRPDEPLWLQYIHYLEGVVQGNLGRSFQYGRPVTGMIFESLPWTVFYMSIALLLGFGFNVLVGSGIAYYEGSRLDLSVTTFFMIFGSIPYYVIGILLVWFFGYQMELFPYSGRVDGTLSTGLTVPFVTSVLAHAALPIASLVIARLGAGLGMRSNAIRILGSDYMRVGRLRGLSEARLATRYLARNAILPAYTGLLISIGALFGGSVILEKIFGYRGIGLYMFRALKASDYPLLMGTFLFITIAVVIGILLADLTYPMIDPRARNSENREQYGGGGGSPVAAVRRLFHSVRDRLQGDSESDTDRTVTDGGAPVFLETTLSLDLDSADESLGERLRTSFDSYVIVPLRIISSDWRGILGLGIVGSFVFIGTVGVMLVEPTAELDAPQTMSPSMEHPLGTDHLGRDIFSLLVHGTPMILKMSIVGAGVSVGVATIVGVYAGYIGGWHERVLMTITDIAMTIPGLPLILVLAAVFEPQNAIMIGILLSVNRWAGLARRLRSQVLTLRDESYVEASRTMGVSTPSILSRGVLPNIMPYILINFINSARGVIYAAVGLYFLEFLPHTAANWGVVMQQANNNGALVNFDLLYWLFAPMATISLYAFGLVMLAQSMDKIFNPRLKARHKERTKDVGNEERPGDGGGDESSHTWIEDDGTEMSERR